MVNAKSARQCWADSHIGMLNRQTATWMLAMIKKVFWMPFWRIQL